MTLTGDPSTTLWTTQEAANAARVEANTVRNWRYRRHLKQARTDKGRPISNAAGQPLYRAIDVIRAETATRDRDRRVYRVPAPATH
ncbi:MerR family transcriptional regulator [Streptomyces sp. NPDC002176]|uniref:MerR family transcriptional regulator n=1 Tax=Streptomyces sp. NPDC002176 TaxID=3364634 RepID=UPI00385040A1